MTENFSVAVAGKLLLGLNQGVRVSVFDEDNDKIAKRIKDYANETLQVGIDLAMMYRAPRWNFAVVGTNLNEPRFEGAVTEEGLKLPTRVLDRQVALGAAWRPFRDVIIETNIELLEQNSILRGFEHQYAGIGAEWDVLKTLALRAGVYDNLAQNSSDPVITAGVGFDLWLIECNVGAAVGTGEVVYQDYTVPNELRLSLGLSSRF